MIATATTTVSVLTFLAVSIGFVVYWFANRNSARAELGSEIELAPNRKPYYDDEILEGPRLERVQWLGFLLLIVIVIGLPLYWVLEPGRQAGAVAQKEATFAGWGKGLYATTAEGGFNCAGCHGAQGGGGQAPYTLTDPNTGEVTAVNWTAPALNTIFYKFDESEVNFIITYGRPFSPMPPWGLAGGGPMNVQQVNTVISYLKTLQLPRMGCAPDETDIRLCPSGTLDVDKQQEIAEAAQQAADALVAEGKYATAQAAMGEALFNLELDFGAYSCARCHTTGWSWGEPQVSGQGAFGWNLTNGATVAHFPNQSDMIAFVAGGSEMGKRYGLVGQGSGRMPGFGAMLTDEQIKSIVEYVRSL